jgi:hypothetical protein
MFSLQDLTKKTIRFGSKADICSALADVRFVPEADMHEVVFRKQKHSHATGRPGSTARTVQAGELSRVVDQEQITRVVKIFS